jgi:hypothetical protein
MIVAFVVVGILVAVVIATLFVVRHDKSGPRPYCETYNSRFPQ